MVFLFFKQKTAYEMRISDWSSDVCYNIYFYSFFWTNFLFHPNFPVKYTGASAAQPTLVRRPRKAPMRYFPAFHDLTARRSLVVGGGEAAGRKLRLLLMEIGRASCREEGVGTCRSGWSPNH